MFLTTYFFLMFFVVLPKLEINGIDPIQFLGSKYLSELLERVKLQFSHTLEYFLILTFHALFNKATTDVLAYLD